MAIYVEKRKYNKKEFAALIGVNPQANNLNRDLKRKLSGMGFSEEDYQILRTEIIILWVPQTPEEKIPYLCRLLGIDTQVDAYNFTTFVYCLLEEEDFQCRPWEERAIWLKDCYGIEVSESTLRHWCSKLMKEDTLIKNKDTYTWWSTTTIDGVKIREELADDDLSIEAYRDFNKEFFNREDVKNMDKKTRGSVWFSEMWNTFGCKFYKCYAYEFSPWHSEILQELINVGREYIEAKYS